MIFASCPRDGQPDDVANEFADGGERSVADPFEVGDHGGQPGPHQAAAFDADGQRGLIDLLAARAPPWVTAMLLDHNRYLLTSTCWITRGTIVRHGLQVMPTPWANIEAMVERIAVDQFRRKVGAFVLGVTRLPADTASLLALRRGWFGRLDDVRGLIPKGATECARSANICRWNRGGARGIQVARGGGPGNGSASGLG